MGEATRGPEQARGCEQRVTQALPGCCVHSQVLWSLPQNQMFAGTVPASDEQSQLHPSSPLRPGRAFALSLRELFYGGRGLRHTRTLPWSVWGARAGRIGYPCPGNVPQCTLGQVAHNCRDASSHPGYCSRSALLSSLNQNLQTVAPWPNPQPCFYK